MQSDFGTSAFNTICSFTQLTRQSEAAISRTPLMLAVPSAYARNIHKTFIYCNWCFQWWKVRNRFMIFPIQYFTIVGMLFYISPSSAGVSYMGMLCSMWARIHSASNIYMAYHKSEINLKLKHCTFFLPFEYLKLFRENQRCFHLASIYNWHGSTWKSKPLGANSTNFYANIIFQLNLRFSAVLCFSLQSLEVSSLVDQECSERSLLNTVNGEEFKS